MSTNHRFFLANRFPKLISLPTSAIFVSGSSGITAILKYRSVNPINLITVNYDKIAYISSESEWKQLLTEYSSFFNGQLPSLPEQMCLQVNEIVPRYTASLGRIPESMIPRVKRELKWLEEFGVIILVDEPTNWNNWSVSLVISGSVSITNTSNKALKRERYQLLLIEEVLPKLTNAKYFTNVDITSAYWHIVFDEESSHLTALLYAKFRQDSWLFVRVKNQQTVYPTEATWRLTVEPSLTNGKATHAGPLRL